MASESDPTTDPTESTTTATPPSESNSATQEKTKPSKPKRRQLPPYKVILHNDDENDMGHVVLTIRKLTTLNGEQALRKMWEAHRTGSAVLLITHRERAELYVEQFASYSLTVTAEPDA